jgi:hypothetical protein
MSGAQRECLSITTYKGGLVSETVVKLAPENQRAEDNELNCAHCCLGPSARASLVLLDLTLTPRCQTSELSML